nr:MAG TPA: hypothetical protein [Bacteriophage sp.]
MKKVQKRIFRIYGARTIKGSKLCVTLNKPFVTEDLEATRKRLFEKYFNTNEYTISDIALTFCTETYYEPEKDRK